MDEEITVWEGSSSQVIKLHVYILCALFCWLIVPIFIAIWKWIELRSRVYQVTTQRIRVRKGIFTKRTEELELYRAKDTALVEPFWYRMFGVGNVIVTTTDVSTPSLTLEGMPHAGSLREEIRKNIEICRDKKRVRLAELE
jgi:uncharacterized membrane protein YdbT with pleckstrin-like domain